MSKNIKTYVDKEMCKKCGGVCCKQNGCIYLPRDFKNMNINYLIQELEKGNISISGQPASVPFLEDVWTYMLYLRSRNEDSPVVDLFTKGGPCINLTENGCVLERKDMPSFGKSIRPTKIGGPCKQMVDPEFMTGSWLEHQELLKRIIMKITGEDFEELLISQINERIDSIKEKISNNEEITSMEELCQSWYKSFMVNKPYCDIEEVKKLTKKIFK